MKPAFLSFALAAALALAACSAKVSAPSLPAAPAPFPPAYADLLQRYVTPAGVRYEAWKNTPADVRALEEVTTFYAGTRPPETSRADALAWHLNAYNAWILRAMLERYPVGGPLDGTPEFFQTRRPVLSGETISFDELEQKRIRTVFHEPRIHFALNCASRSCPPLSEKPFAAAGLDEHLDTLARDFIAKGGATTGPDGAIHLSRIFDWYAADFGGKDQVVTYINQFRPEKLATGAPVTFAEYDWALNSAP